MRPLTPSTRSAQIPFPLDFPLSLSKEPSVPL